MSAILTGLISVFAALQASPAANEPQIIVDERATFEPSSIQQEVYTNYMKEPETVEATPTVNASDLRLTQDIELGLSLSSIERALSDCVDQRKTLEIKIGDQPGSYSVNKVWVKKYQNCLLQRDADIDVFGAALSQRYEATISGAGAESISSLTPLLDRLKIKHSEISRKIDEEVRLQKQFVQYYNTGERSY